MVAVLETVFKVYLNEVFLDPFIILNCIIHGRLLPITQDVSMRHIWELGGGVVAPDDHVPHSICSHTNTSGNLHTRKEQISPIGARYIVPLAFTYLRLCSVLVKACETGEVLLGNGRGKVGANHGVGVGWVTHHHHLCVGRRGRKGEERKGERGKRGEEMDGERGEGEKEGRRGMERGGKVKKR